jgi:hypothetical protein
MQDLKNEKIRQAVPESDGENAKSGAVGCGCDCGCLPGNNQTAEDNAIRLGPSNDDVTTAAEDANFTI